MTPESVTRDSLVDVVVLDMGGVVCSYAPQRRLRALSEMTGCSPQEVNDALFGSGLDDRAEHGALSLDELYEAIASELTMTLDRSLLRRAWSQAFSPDGDLLGVVRRVRRPTALFTNNGPIIEDCLANELSSVTTAFDRLLVSWRLGSAKPEPEAFAKATAALGTEANAVLFVDDDLDNVRAAARAGWISHHYRGPNRLRDLFEAHDLLPCR